MCLQNQQQQNKATDTHIKATNQKSQKFQCCFNAGQQDLMRLTKEWDHDCSVCHCMHCVWDDRSAVAQGAQACCPRGDTEGQMLKWRLEATQGNINKVTLPYSLKPIPQIDRQGNMCHQKFI